MSLISKKSLEYSNKSLKKKSTSGKCQSQGGWTSGDLLLTLIAVLLLTIAGYFVFQMIKNNANIANTRQSLMVSKSNIERLFSNQSSYNGLDNGLVVRAKLAPSSWVMGDMNSTAITTKFGGQVTFEPDTAGTYGAANAHYRITVEDIPQDACIEYATYTRTDWVDVLVGGTSISEDNVAAASSACSDQEKNQLVFVSR